MTTKAAWARWAFLFVTVCVLHLRGVTTVWDSRWTIHTALQRVPGAD